MSSEFNAEATSELQPLSKQPSQGTANSRFTEALEKTTNLEPRGLDRKWLPVKHYQINIMTWNVLAQTLIRRSLYSESDCLKASQRDPMIISEILTSRADVICLQEVDRLEKIVPRVREAKYSLSFASGRDKKHGCMILFRDALFAKVQEKVIHYDEIDIQGETNSIKGLGLSFKTKNIGLLVALRRFGTAGGCIIATTHLFWHPMYAYERARQTAILIREVVKFKQEMGGDAWPCFIAGGMSTNHSILSDLTSFNVDFNFAPDEAAYALLTKNPLSQDAKDAIDLSRVVHATVDDSVNTGSDPKLDIDEPSEDPDRVIVNARNCRDADGLLTIDELEGTFASLPRLRSAYYEAYECLNLTDSPVFGVRHQPRGEIAVGHYEPMWTAYAQYWKTTLDYIFIAEPKDSVEVSGVVEVPRTESLQPSLPRKGVSASDHIPLNAELSIKRRFSNSGSSLE